MPTYHYLRKIFSKKKWLLLIIPLFFLKSLRAQENFYWKWQVVKDSLQITGKFKGQKEINVMVAGSATKERFAKVYEIIDLLKYHQANVYDHTIDTLSKQLVLPFKGQIKECKTVVVDIDSSLIGFPLEFLKVDGEAIALRRPMVFRINNRPGKEGPDTLTLHQGFIIRDPTSDPDDACATTFYRYPASKYKSAYGISAKDLAQKYSADFFLISAHGYVDSSTFQGRIFMKEIPVRPGLFTLNNPRLIYLDACQQGINWAYISPLTQKAETNFYLGPIVSNDSGESSTKTINWFFSYLKLVGNPIIAIWKTRKRLYNHYHKKLNNMDEVNKAFIFRIYKL